MAVVVRMQRAGGRNRPFYRVVVADSRRARDGRFLENVGHYDPIKNPAEIHLEVERIKEWVSKGARLSDGVTQLLKRFEERVEAKPQESAQTDG